MEDGLAAILLLLTAFGLRGASIPAPRLLMTAILVMAAAQFVDAADDVTALAGMPILGRGGFAHEFVEDTILRLGGFLLLCWWAWRARSLQPSP